MPAPNYEDQIFINCPFDEKYFPIFRAVIFAVYRCGFYPNTARIKYSYGGISEI